MKQYRAIHLAGFFALMGSSLLAEDDVTTFGAESQVGRSAGLDLPSEAKRSYRDFRKYASYFGAFAVSPESGESFYVMNFHDASAARASAMEGCRQISRKQDCVLFAVAMPKSLAASTRHAKGLGLESWETFTGAYVTGRKPGKYYAFAISGAYNYGYATAWDTAEFARDTALAYCQKGVARDMVGIGPLGRAWVRNRGIDRCRIVDEGRMPQG